MPVAICLSALDQTPLGRCVGSGLLDCLKDGSRVGKPVADTTDHKGFKGNGRDSLAVGLARPSQQGPRDVIPVAGAPLVRMGRAHPAAVGIEQDPHQQAWLLACPSGGSVDAVLGQDGLDLVPERLVDDGLMLARIALALVDDLATIDPVLQHQVERTASQRLAAIATAIGCRPDLADDAGGIKVLLQFPDRLEFGVTPEDVSDRLGFRRR